MKDWSKNYLKVFDLKSWKVSTRSIIKSHQDHKKVVVVILKSSTYLEKSAPDLQKVMFVKNHLNLKTSKLQNPSFLPAPCYLYFRSEILTLLSLLKDHPKSHFYTYTITVAFRYKESSTSTLQNPTPLPYNHQQTLINL